MVAVLVYVRCFDACTKKLPNDTVLRMDFQSGTGLLTHWFRQGLTSFSMLWAMSDPIYLSFYYICSA